MVGLALSSIAAGIFDVKHHLHLQLVPHLSKHYQYWRIFSHQLACSNSSDLFLSELLLYNAAIHIERSFGSVKFASFLFLAAALNSLSIFMSLLILHPLPYFGATSNYIPSGPTAVLFSITYQYSRLLPRAYQFKIFGVTMSDKIWVYAIAMQLALSYTPATLLPALLGIITGYIYRSDILQLKGWRVPYKLVNFSRNWIQPLLGGERTVRRTNRVLPESQQISSENDEIITTARLPQAQEGGGTSPTQSGSAVEGPSADTNTQGSASSAGVVRQWVSELAGAARGNPSGEGTVRVPSDAEIRLLTDMFPSVERSVLLGVLQRSANIEAAAQTLLASQS